MLIGSERFGVVMSSGVEAEPPRRCKMKTNRTCIIITNSTSQFVVSVLSTHGFGDRLEGSTNAFHTVCNG